MRWEGKRRAQEGKLGSNPDAGFSLFLLQSRADPPESGCVASCADSHAFYTLSASLVCQITSVDHTCVSHQFCKHAHASRSQLFALTSPADVRALYPSAQAMDLTRTLPGHWQIVYQSSEVFSVNITGQPLSYRITPLGAAR